MESLLSPDQDNGESRSSSVSSNQQKENKSAINPTVYLMFYHLLKVKEKWFSFQCLSNYRLFLLSLSWNLYDGLL